MNEDAEARLIRMERAVGNMAALLLELAVNRGGVDLRPGHPQEEVRRSVQEIFPWRKAEP